MSKIQVLSKRVAELIAAGEVVERPASVVKEVMENSIDAGATSVTVEIKNGGITYIRVTDNGSGIAREDVPSAFLSHATSKINDEDDLAGIMTLGFRGEALASIAAVSRVEIMTRTADEETGTRLVLEGGDEVALDEAGCPKGTTLLIRDLFYNTPARMKFLKRDVSEANAVAGVVDRMALSHPEIGIRFIKDGKQALLTHGDGDLGNTVYSVFGKEFYEGLIPADYTLEQIRVNGFVSKPEAARPNRSMQFFFLNGRLIKTPACSTALGEAYRHSIAAGKFPCCVINISIPPECVDVNVHPAKTEARFTNEKLVFNSVYYCAKNALQGGYARPRLSTAAVRQYFNTLEDTRQIEITETRGTVAADASGETEQPSLKATVTGALTQQVREQTVLREEVSCFDEFAPNPEIPQAVGTVDTAQPGGACPEGEKTETAEPARIEFALMGEAFQTYLFVQQGDNILIIDKHSAHERMIFDSLKNRETQEGSQILLSPVPVTLQKEDYSALLENLDLLGKAGFDAEDFGNGSVIIRECPMILEIGDVADVIMELAGSFSSKKHEPVPAKMDLLYHSIACRAAVKAGDFTSETEKEHFVRRLLDSPEIRNCPHGRPVIIEMTKKDLEKSFGRL